MTLDRGNTGPTGHVFNNGLKQRYKTGARRFPSVVGRVIVMEPCGAATAVWDAFTADRLPIKSTGRKGQRDRWSASAFTRRTATG